MADAVNRTGAGVGTLLIVPAAGVTHAASGIGEAGIDGIPMLIISGGIHTASGTRYQLHEMDQHALLAPITKKTWQITRHSDVIPTLYEAYNTAVTGEPDQCSWRFPTTSVTLSGMWMTCPTSRRQELPPIPPEASIRAAAEALVEARKPGIFVGWGALMPRKASEPWPTTWMRPWPRPFRG